MVITMLYRRQTIGKNEAKTASNVLSEDERAHLENGLRVLAKIIAKVYLKEKSLIDHKIDREKVEVPTPFTGNNTILNAKSDSDLTITVHEVAKLLGISRTATYETIRTGQIPGIKIGRRIIIPKVALIKML
jgi:excisionase family DNA binding protein